MADPDEQIRKTIALPKSLWDAVSEYRFDNRIASEAEAVRLLLRLGLKAGRVRSRR